MKTTLGNSDWTVAQAALMCRVPMKPFGHIVSEISSSGMSTITEGLHPPLNDDSIPWALLALGFFKAFSLFNLTFVQSC